MREIPLRARDGSVRAMALVDDEDYEWLMQWRWSMSGAGYVQRRQGRSTVLIHRELLGLRVGDGREGDHEDGDPLNNQRSNLRECSHAQNLQNRRRSAARRRGVSWEPGRKRWAAYVNVAGKKHHLGRFADLESAITAAENGRKAMMTHATS